MCERMTSQIAITPENFAAGRALVWFVVGVREQVRFQIGALIEAATADGTLVRRLFHVEDLVDGECARLAETLATFGTFEWLLLRVYVPMGMKKKELSCT